MIHGFRAGARIRTWTTRADLIPHKEHILPVVCGCVVHVHADWSGHIVLCSFHHAAPDLLEAAKFSLARPASRETAAKLEAAIGKGRGKVKNITRETDSGWKGTDQAGRSLKFDLYGIPWFEPLHFVLESDLDRRRSSGPRVNSQLALPHLDLKRMTAIVDAHGQPSQLRGQARVKKEFVASGLDAGMGALNDVNCAGHGPKMNTLRRAQSTAHQAFRRPPGRRRVEVKGIPRNLGRRRNHNGSENCT